VITSSSDRATMSTRTEANSRPARSARTGNRQAGRPAMSSASGDTRETSGNCLPERSFDGQRCCRPELVGAGAKGFDGHKAPIQRIPDHAGQLVDLQA